MKKYLYILIAAILMAGCLSACSSGSGQTAANNGKIQVVTTIFPEYDWVMNILGENPAGIEAAMLLDSGVDLHSYQPTADDILKISTCDLFIYVGGESDEWVDDALQEATNKDMVAEQDLDYDTTIKDNKFGHRRPTDKSAVEASYVDDVMTEKDFNAYVNNMAASDTDVLEDDLEVMQDFWSKNAKKDDTIKMKTDELQDPKLLHLYKKTF